jgi:hypothetical protein
MESSDQLKKLSNDFIPGIFSRAIKISSNNNTTLAIPPKRPFMEEFIKNGFLMYLEVEPTNCNVLIVNRCE